MKTVFVWVVLMLCGGVTVANAEEIQILDSAAANQLANPASHSAPTVVALWALDCPHCKKYLQELGELARSHEQMQIVTVAVEPLHEEHRAVLDELNMDRDGQRYAYGDEVPAVLGYALDPDWRGELPRALFFDGRGNKLARSGRLSMEAVKQLLALEEQAD